jgi:AcrR family transcriptional regulator
MQSAKSGGREERVRRRRREMLEAYYDVLVDEGISGASLAKIAKRLDIPDSLLIRYFTTKADMTIALVDLILDEYIEHYINTFPSVDHPLDRLHAMLDATFSTDYQDLVDAKVWYACFYVSLYEPHVREQFQRLHQLSQDLWEETLAVCMNGGLIPPQAPSTVAAVISALERGFEWSLATMTDQQERRELGSLLKEQAVQTIGISGGSPAGE